MNTLIQHGCLKLIRSEKISLFQINAVLNFLLKREFNQKCKLCHYFTHMLFQISMDFFLVLNTKDI